MRRALTTLVLASLAVPTVTMAADEDEAAGLLVWLEARVPEEKLVRKAEKRTGELTHLAHVDLAFPPMPVTPDDNLAYEALRSSIADGKARWDDFEVELPIAAELEERLYAIDVIRDKRDLQDIVSARLFQGAAVSIAFEPSDFLQAEEALPFRAQLPGVRVNNPWLQAMAISRSREFTGADLGDGAAFPELKKMQKQIGELDDGTIDMTALPEGAVMVVDGVQVEATAGTLTVRPGTHYVHVLRHDAVGGRQRVEVLPGEVLAVPMVVDDTELEQARLRVIQGTATGFPDDVKRSLDELMNTYDGPVFVGAVEDGRVEVLEYARGARLLPKRAVTVSFSGDLGGGIIQSTGFRDHVGVEDSGPMGHGGVGMELGIYNGVLLGGLDVAAHPGSNMLYDPRFSSSVSDQIPLSLHPYAGIGAYILRPYGRAPTLLVAGTYGWHFPAYSPLGARVAFGIPLDDAAWFRITAGATKATGFTDLQPRAEGSQTWDQWYAAETADLTDEAGNPQEPMDPGMFTGFLRVGFATRF